MNPVEPVSTTFIAEQSPCRYSIKRLLEFIARDVNLSSRRLTCLRPVAGLAAEHPGERRNELSLDLLLGLAPELGPNGREGKPVQEFGCAADTEVQVTVLDVRKIRLQHPPDIRANPLEAGGEAMPSLWGIDTGPRHNPHHSEVTTPHRQRPRHRSSERRCHFVDRGLRTEAAHRLLLRVQVALQRVLDRLLTQRPE